MRFVNALNASLFKLLWTNPNGGLAFASQNIVTVPDNCPFVLVTSIGAKGLAQLGTDKCVLIPRNGQGFYTDGTNARTIEFNGTTGIIHTTVTVGSADAHIPLQIYGWFGGYPLPNI